MKKIFIVLTVLSTIVNMQVFADNSLYNRETSERYEYIEGGLWWIGSRTQVHGQSWQSTPPTPNDMYLRPTGLGPGSAVSKGNAAALGYTAHNPRWVNPSAPPDLRAGSHPAESRYSKQARIDYYRNKTTPSLRNLAVSGHRYSSGANYWVRPHESVRVSVESYQDFSGVKYAHKDYVSENQLLVHYDSTTAVAANRRNQAWASYNGNSNIVQVSYHSNSYGDYKGDTNRAFKTEFNVSPKRNLDTIQLGGNIYSANGKGSGHLWQSKYIKTDGTVPTVSISGNSNWTKNNVVVSSGSSDVGSGVRSHQMYSKGAQNIGWASRKSLTISSEGVTTVQGYAEDNVGHQSYSNELNVRIDRTVPTGSFSVDNNWNNGIGVTFNPGDSLSGVARWQYRISTNNGSSWGNWSSNQSGARVIKLTSGGINKIEVWVVDNAGNEKYFMSPSVTVDTVAPNIDFEGVPTGWINTTANVLVKPSDAISGVARWQYRVSNNGGNGWGAWSSNQNGQKTIQVSTEGQNMIEVWAVDNAGNEAYKRTPLIRIDKTVPTISLSEIPKNWTNQDVSVQINPSDLGGSNLKNWQYRVSGDGGKNWGSWSSNQSASKSVKITTQGQNMIEVWAIDNARNEVYLRSSLIKIDKEAPSLLLEYIKESPNTQDRFKIELSSISDNLSGVSKVVVGYGPVYKDKKEFSIEGKKDFAFELDKYMYIKDVEIYVKAFDIAGNSVERVVNTFYEPHPPNKPILTNPLENDLFLLNEFIDVAWDYSDRYGFPQLKAQVILKNIETKETYTVPVLAQSNPSLMFVNSYPGGDYELKVIVTNSENKSAESDVLNIRLTRFNMTGKFTTVDIGHKDMPPIKNIKLVGDISSYLSKDSATISGYIVLPKNQIGQNLVFDMNDLGSRIPFNFDLTTANNVFEYTLPRYVNGLKIVFDMTSKDRSKTPLLDKITIFAK